MVTTGDQDYINSTVIDGSGLGTVVTFESGEDSRAMVTGFTITNGLAADGGGIRCIDSSPSIFRNLIAENTTYKGLWPYGQGAGIYCENSEATIANNVIANNTATGPDGGRGGGIFCQNSSPDIINNTLFGNESLWYGGAICCIFSSPNITNTILWANTADVGPEIYIDEGDPVVTYSDIYAGWEGEGNVNSNPEFRNRVNGDFHLMSTAYGFPYDSPCIDIGAPYTRDFAMDSLWGLGTTMADMGAYGGGDYEFAGIEDDGPATPSRIAVRGNYPNPFNPRTVIRFELAETANVSIEIFDILGRSIETIANSDFSAGEHRLEWSGENVAGGVYFYTVKSGDFEITRKMLLLK